MFKGQIAESAHQRTAVEGVGDPEVVALHVAGNALLVHGKFIRIVNKLNAHVLNRLDGSAHFVVQLAFVANAQIHIVLLGFAVKVGDGVEVAGNQRVNAELHAVHRVDGQLAHVDVVPGNRDVVAALAGVHFGEGRVDPDKQVLGKGLVVLGHLELADLAGILPFYCQRKALAGRSLAPCDGGRFPGLCCHCFRLRFSRLCRWSW